MERILLSAKDWLGGPRDVVVNFGHVRGFDHGETLAYFRRKRQQGPAWMPWHLLRSDPKFRAMGQLDGLQAADLYAGMLNAALCEDEFGGYEEHHILAVRHQIRRVGGKTWGYGFKVMAHPSTWTTIPGGHREECDETFEGPERRNRTVPEGPGSRPDVLSATFEGLDMTKLYRGTTQRRSDG